MLVLDFIGDKFVDMLQSNQYKGYALGILSSASFGLIPLFSLPVLASGMPHETLVFWRFLFSAINVCLVLAVQQIGALPTAILGAMEPLTAVALGVL